MAVDQLMYQGNKKPNLCVLVSLLKRKNWTGSSIGTPCGACLEMFWELSMKLDMNDLHFLCVSWNKKKVLKVKLSELYPRFDAVRR
jgi:cytidine deaminase